MGGASAPASRVASPCSSAARGMKRCLLHGQDRLYYQGDGNLVLYTSTWGFLWESNTDGTIPGQTVMQGDGNLVVYEPDMNDVWSSGTWGHPGAYAVVQNSGNLKNA